MIRWSLAAELLALIIISILIIYYYERKPTSSYKRKMYHMCLWMSILSIIIDVICVYMVDFSYQVPYWINMLFNSSYFISIIFTCSLLAIYLFSLTLEHVYSKIFLKCFKRIVLLLNVSFFILVIWNLKSGVLFYFDKSGRYCRGPLNAVGYGIMGIEMIMLAVCYIRNKASVSKPVIRLINTLPFIVAVFIIFQHMYPGLLLNGMFMAITNMVIFISFQTRKSDMDSLTYAGSRNSFFEEISLRIAGKQSFQIILLSLKQFSVINEKYTYQKGDEFLYVIAQAIDRIISNAKAFRFGNVEFAVILPYESDEKAYGNLMRIKERFEEKWELGEIWSYIPAYFTDIVYTGQNWSPSQMIEYLEAGMRIAKKDPNNLHRFDEYIIESFRKRKELLEIMQRSIEQKRFKVWYQPIYNLNKHGFLSAEALLRLKDYNGDPVSPSEFIPLAEDTGMIDDLSWIVLEEVCEFLEHFQGTIESVSINLSMQQFEDRNLAARIHDSLERHHLTPNKLKIEITERVLLQDMNYMKNVVESLTEDGICFYLDDFGTGYSNISSALSLPFECVKLDRSLLEDLPGNHKSEVFVKNMIETFRAMGQKVVAEGVERQEQVEILKSYGSDYIQGFYFGKPMPEDEFTAFILEKQGVQK